MTESRFPLVFTAGVAAGTYYGPIAPGVAGFAGNLTWTNAVGSGWISMDGYDDIAFVGTVTAVGAATATLTIWSDDGIAGTFLMNETPGGYNSLTNTYPVSYVGTGGANTLFHVHFDRANNRRWQVRLVTSDNTGACSLSIMRYRRR